MAPEMTTTESALVRWTPAYYTRTDVLRFRISFVTSIVLLALLAACESSDNAPPTGIDPPPTTINGSTVVPVTPVDKPPTVPTGAQPIERTTTLGRFVRRADEPPESIETRQLEDASCENELLVFQTSAETIYAPHACASFWYAEQRADYVGNEVAIVLEVAETRFRILIETAAGAQAEFTVPGIWVE